ncbi:hypothetical protein ONZ51_g10748 [Trametes cubensis]|uniref:Uncharacterized protein n=1 Tax=Trametes cubensis TaxID=1111947 RepID=A0AAD7TIU9_9APHY|nr:hypothetical protein ONZ51_g10748 [Trametes cubensis]
MSLDIMQCTAKTFTEPHGEHPRVLKHVSIEARHPTEGRVGLLTALHIDREQCRGDFFGIMDEESQELSDFALTLFDRFGRLKSELVENDYLKGSGVWGRELDRGPILYVEDIQVPEKVHYPSSPLRTFLDLHSIQFRRNGVASFLLQNLAESNLVSAGTFYFAWPTPTIRPDNEDEWKQQRHAALDLFHKNHYRRVGRTSFLCYALDPAHPSRVIAIGDDVDSHVNAFQGGGEPVPTQQGAGLRILPDGSFAWGEHADQDVNAANDAPYPLHFMMEAKNLGIPVRDLPGAIRGAYSQNPAAVRQKDDRGFTPLHVAAYAGNAEAVRVLLALPETSGIAEDMRGRDNVAGRTPLELCEQKMRDIKDSDALRVVYTLKRAMGEDIPLTEDQYVDQRRLGCTCGQCTDGWLSPRMRYRLLSEAEITSDTMDMSTWGMGSYGSFTSDLAIMRLPEELREGRITKSFYLGYAAVVRAIASVLQRPGVAGLPTAANVEGLLRGQGARFFNQGGRVEHAMDYVLHCAHEQSPYGDGTWDQDREDLAAEGDPSSVAYAAMPIYRSSAYFGNDYEDEDEDDDEDMDDEE